MNWKLSILLSPRRSGSSGHAPKEFTKKQVNVTNLTHDMPTRDSNNSILGTNILVSIGSGNSPPENASKELARDSEKHIQGAGARLSIYSDKSVPENGGKELAYDSDKPVRGNDVLVPSDSDKSVPENGGESLTYDSDKPIEGNVVLVSSDSDKSVPENGGKELAQYSDKHIQGNAVLVSSDGDKPVPENGGESLMHDSDKPIEWNLVLVSSDSGNSVPENGGKELAQYSDKHIQGNAVLVSSDSDKSVPENGGESLTYDSDKPIEWNVVLVSSDSGNSVPENGGQESGRDHDNSITGTDILMSSDSDSAHDSKDATQDLFNLQRETVGIVGVMAGNNSEGDNHGDSETVITYSVNGWVGPSLGFLLNHSIILDPRYTWGFHLGLPEVSTSEQEIGEEGVSDFLFGVITPFEDILSQFKGDIFLDLTNILGRPERQWQVNGEMENWRGFMNSLYQFLSSLNCGGRKIFFSYIRSSALRSDFFADASPKIFLKNLGHFIRDTLPPNLVENFSICAGLYIQCDEHAFQSRAFEGYIDSFYQVISTPNRMQILFGMQTAAPMDEHDIEDLIMRQESILFLGNTGIVYEFHHGGLDEILEVLNAAIAGLPNGNEPIHFKINLKCDDSSGSLYCGVGSEPLKLHLEMISQMIHVWQADKDPSEVRPFKILIDDYVHIGCIDNTTKCVGHPHSMAKGPGQSSEIPTAIRNGHVEFSKCYSLIIATADIEHYLNKRERGEIPRYKDLKDNCTSVLNPRANIPITAAELCGDIFVDASFSVASVMFPYRKEDIVKNIIRLIRFIRKQRKESKIFLMYNTGFEYGDDISEAANIMVFMKNVFGLLTSIKSNLENEIDISTILGVHADFQLPHPGDRLNTFLPILFYLELFRLSLNLLSPFAISAKLELPFLPVESDDDLNEFNRLISTKSQVHLYSESIFLDDIKFLSGIGFTSVHLKLDGSCLLPDGKNMECSIPELVENFASGLKAASIKLEKRSPDFKIVIDLSLIELCS